MTGVPIPSMNWKSINLPEEFRKFKRSVVYIFKGPLKDESDEVKIQYLLMWVGPDGADIRDGWALSATNEKDLEMHWTNFESYVKPKTNYRVARFQMRALKQEAGESIDSFVTRAKVIATKCQYDDMDDALLDTLIAGVHDESLQRKLIGKDDTLTLDRALDIIRSFESTRSRIADIQETKRVHSIDKTPGKRLTKGKQNWQRPQKYDNKTKPKFTPPFKTGVCWNCGNPHAREATCPAAGATCHECSKVGHYSKMCLSKTRTDKPHLKSKEPQPRKIHEVADDIAKVTSNFAGFGFDTVEVLASDTSDPEITTARSITVHSVLNEVIQRDQAFASIYMNATDAIYTVKCKIDTGAQSNVMPVRIFKQLFPRQIDTQGNPTGLQPCDAKLSAYGGSPITQYGLCNLQCSHLGKAITAPFFITDAGGHTMLGLSMCIKLGLISLNCSS